MILWTIEGPIPASENNKRTLADIQESINNAILEHDAKITVRQFYEEYLGVRLCCDRFLIDGETFVDPDDWGWDKKGFRQLYRTRCIREEL